MFGQVNAGYIGTDDGGLTGSGFGADITPALAIYVHNGLALNFAVGGINFSTMDYSGLKQTNFGITFGQQISFGISKNFGGGCCKKGGHHTMGDSMRNDDMKKMSDDSDDDDGDE